MPDEKEEMTPRLVVCTGITELTDGKLGAVLQEVIDGKIDPRRLVFEEKFTAKAFVRTGGTYTLPATADFSRARIKDAKYEGLWGDEADRIRWKADEDALRGARNALKRQKLDLSSNPIREALEPLRIAWIETNYTGRLALEVQLLAYLRTGKAIGKES